MVHNSSNIAVASSEGVKIYDFMKGYESSLGKFLSINFDNEVILLKSFGLPNT